MSVRYTARALAQLAEVFDYIARDNPVAARGLHAKIKASIENLSRFPFAGRATDRPDVRVLTITRFPYRVFYTVHQDNHVVILRILHAARDQTRLEV
jgi:addiction module RelE/StbE family toxin